MGARASSLKAQPGMIITLDALGTLYRFREPIANQYMKVAHGCGLQAQIDPNELNQAFKSSYKSINSEYPNYGKGKLASPRAWWKTLVNDSFRQVVDESKIPDHLGEALYDHFTSSAAYELYPDVKPFFADLRELKDKWSRPEDPSILVGVVSNSDPRVKRVLQSLSLRVGIEHDINISNVQEQIKDRAQNRQLSREDILKSPWHDVYNSLNDVDFLATSYEAGSEKPEIGIFNLAHRLASLNECSRHEQSMDFKGSRFAVIKEQWSNLRQSEENILHSMKVHIGDDFNKDYLGSQAAGFEALHLAREGESSTHEGAQTITSLEQASVLVNVMAEANFKKDDAPP